MKNKYVIIILILFSNLSIAQESFSHSIGTTGFFGTRKAYLTSVGILYSPRLNVFKVSESSTLSVGTNFGIGYNVDNNFVDGNQITLHIPIIVDYNFGLGSGNKTITNKNGGFLGIGYSFDQAGIRIINGNFNETILVKKAIRGPIANIGYRFKIGSKPFGIRVSYLYGTGDFSGGYLSTLSIQYLFN